MDVHRDQVLQRWAFERAEFRNGHFEIDGLPWQASDFLGTANRDERKMEHARSQLEVQRMNRQLQQPLTREMVPAWALEIEANAAKRAELARNGGG